MAAPNEPLNREEGYYAAMLGDSDSMPSEPLSRKERYLENIVEAAKREVVDRIIINLEGDDGTLTEEQIALVSDDEANVVFNNGGKIFYLFNRQPDLSYRTFMNMDIATTTGVEFSAIYVQLSKTAANYGRWTKEVL